MRERVTWRDVTRGVQRRGYRILNEVGVAQELQNFLPPAPNWQCEGGALTNVLLGHDGDKVGLYEGVG